MSNIKPDSVIACLDAPTHIQAVLDASIWISRILSAPIGLLHAVPSIHHKAAIDYSGCLIGNDDEHLLNKLTHEEYDSNGKLRDQGRLLLKQSDTYCHQRLAQRTYTLHRHSTIAESLDYVDEVAKFIVIGHKVTCKNSLSQLIRPTKCPVLITHEQFTVPKTALFAFDNRPTCHAFLDWMCQSPICRHLTIHIVMIGKETEQNKDALREAYARLKQAGIDCKKKLINERNVASSLMYYQKQNNLGLMMTGAFSESRLHELLRGSDTQQLLDASRTPYLLFPSKH